MKLSYKLVLWTVMVIASVIGAGGYYFVNYVFDTALNREIGQAQDESSILRFAFETAALNAPVKYDILQDSVVEQIAVNMEQKGNNSSRMLRLCDEKKEAVYASDGFAVDYKLLDQTNEENKTYRVIRQSGKYYIQTGIMVAVMDRTLYLENLKDVSEIFEERKLGFRVYRRVTVILLICSTLIMHFISAWLTRPICVLKQATEKMSEGDYAYRAAKVSQDELGQLTVDFNRMADRLEENIHKLEEEARAREEFVAAFAHELKTPLTAIIGYADVLRSRKLDEEKHFLSANYIYTEGRRLEAMAFRLLDIMVTKQNPTDFQSVSVPKLFQYLSVTYPSGRQGMELTIQYEDGTVRADANLIQSVLLNLLDNAWKASEPKGRIEVSGYHSDSGYCFEVRDYGIGIPIKEQKKILKAFYMVDKSRSRSKNGAGLGLALCEEILHLHGSKLEIESAPGKGTKVSFVLPEEEWD